MNQKVHNACIEFAQNDHSHVATDNVHAEGDAFYSYEMMIALKTTWVIGRRIAWVSSESRSKTTTKHQTLVAGALASAGFYVVGGYYPPKTKREAEKRLKADRALQEVFEAKMAKKNAKRDDEVRALRAAAAHQKAEQDKLNAHLDAREKAAPWGGKVGLYLINGGRS